MCGSVHVNGTRVTGGSSMRKEDIERMIEEEGVEFIRLQFTDIYGRLKNVAVTAGQMEKVFDNKYSF